MNNMQSTVSKCEQTVGDCNLRVKTMDGVVSNHTDTISEMQKDIDDLKEWIERLDKTMKEDEEKIGTNQINIENLTININECEKRLNAQISEQEQLLEEHTREIDELKRRPSGEGGIMEPFFTKEMYQYLSTTYCTIQDRDNIIKRLDALEQIVAKNMKNCETKDAALELDIAKVERALREIENQTSNNFKSDRIRIKQLEEKEYPVGGGGDVHREEFEVLEKRVHDLETALALLKDHILKLI